MSKPKTANYLSLLPGMLRRMHSRIVSGARWRGLWPQRALRAYAKAAVYATAAQTGKSYLNRLV